MKAYSLPALIAVFIMGSGAASAAYKGPQISVKEMRHDFGSVKQGTKVSHVFEVLNSGSETLIIEKVQAG